MTFVARESDIQPAAGPAQVDVLVTYGPITIKVTEDIGHLRSFWGQLGHVLEQAEHPAAAETPKEF